MNIQSSNPPTVAVSVIMPAYGVAEYIGAALDSVLYQTFTDYEIIVINDGAPDTVELEAVLERYRDRIVYLKHENRGLSEARNTAIRVARGRYLALLDPDDLWEPEYLAAQVGLLESDPTIDAVYPNALLFGETVNAGKTYMDICPSEGEVTFESLIIERCQVAIFVTARKEAVVRAGMFDPSIRISGDFDLWLRMVKQGARIVYTRDVLARRRCRPDALSANRAGLHEDILRIFDKAEKYDLTPAERLTVGRERAKHQAMVHLYKGKRAFVAGDFNAAVGYLKSANAFFKSRKLAVVAIALRFAPHLLLRVQNLRDWVVSSRTKTATHGAAFFATIFAPSLFSS
jgi:glycosyltransferase involved in cell wall biosynthesis